MSNYTDRLPTFMETDHVVRHGGGAGGGGSQTYIEMITEDTHLQLMISNADAKFEAWLVKAPIY